MATLTDRDRWDAAWGDRDLWVQLFADVKQAVTPHAWAHDFVPFLERCRLVRATQKPIGRVLMHRAFQGLLHAGHAQAAPAFVHVNPNTGHCSLSTTKKDITDIIAYVNAVHERTGNIIYVVRATARDAKFSVSSFANKPVDVQMALTAGGRESADII